MIVAVRIYNTIMLSIKNKHESRLGQKKGIDIKSFQYSKNTTLQFLLGSSKATCSAKHDQALYLPSFA